MSEIRRILWVAATAAELESVPSLREGWSTLATGCGPAAAGARLGLVLGSAPLPELVVGVGIAGAYPRTGLGLGETLRIESECFADLGVQDGDRFVDLLELGLPDPGVRSGWDLAAPAFLASLPVARGTTCSVCTGSAEVAAERRRRTGASLESMEGAAWALACAAAGVPFAQVRAVSNVAGPRDRAAWRIPQALEALKRTLEESCRSI